MIDEFLIAAVFPGWRWLHVVMGVIFAFGAGWSFAQGALLLVWVGLFALFRGISEIVIAFEVADLTSLTRR
jgi:hypothetical protein